MSFARALLQHGGSAVSGRVGLVPTALGGTSLSDWDPDGALFGFMVEHTRQAMRKAPSARLKGMVWVQVGLGSSWVPGWPQ